ncbi:MAG: hypothetical protein QM813_26535 [Verrucomicrobiota bacterium]
MQAVLVEALANGSLIRCETIKDSHSSPCFSEVIVRVLSLREGLVARLSISGTVRSRVCDMVTGMRGTIQAVTMRVNSEHTTSIPTQVEKSPNWHSLYQPYPMIAKFAVEIDDVRVSGGGNTIELFASDSVSGFCLSGTIQLGFNLGFDWAESNPPEGNPTIHKVGEKSYYTWGPELDAQSAGGELHVYYVCFDGPGSISSNGKPPTFELTGGHYLAGVDGRPEPQILSVAAASNPLERAKKPAAPTFESGFLEGFVFCRAAFALGSLKLERNERTKSLEVYLSGESARLCRLADTRLGNLGSQVSNYSDAVRAVYEYVLAVNERNYPILLAAAAETWEKFSAQSKELGVFGVYVPEILEFAYKDFGATTNPNRRGYFQGLICGETLALIISEHKLGNTHKTQILTKLKSADAFLLGRPTLVDRVLDVWRSLPFG